jgi:hypothetical protein
MKKFFKTYWYYDATSNPAKLRVSLENKNTKVTLILVRRYVKNANYLVKIHAYYFGNHTSTVINFNNTVLNTKPHKTIKSSNLQYTIKTRQKEW